MTTLKHLLLVSQNVENEQALFDWTLALAKQHNAKVTVLRVFPEVDVGLISWFKDMVPKEFMGKQTQSALEAFKDWKSQANQADITLEMKIEFGKVFYQAIQLVLKESVDLMIKLTDEEVKDLNSHIFGSHDLHLLRKCPCPILLHKLGTALPFKNVMASIDVDLEDESLQADEFNQAILALSVHIAQLNQAELKVAHAWQADAENLVHYWNSNLTDADLFEFTENVRRQHANALEDDIQVSRSAFPNLEVIMPKGLAVEAIPLVAEKNQVDLLVMGTLGRNGLPGIIIGNTSESILEKINCSVLALKPKNFVSPISL